MERNSMDHELAVKSQACEKYLLGELSPELRDAYEEHYFGCPACTAQVQAAADLIGAGRRILATVPVVDAKPDYVRVPGGWFPWLQPAIAIPAFAVLLLVIGYQNFVTIPHWKHAAEPRVLPIFSLISANTRGEGGLLFSVAPDEPFGVYVDVPVEPGYSNYLLRLEDPAGASTLLRSLTAQEAQKTQVVTVDPGRKSGKFVVVVSGLSTPGAEASSAKEIARLQFTVELKK
jgi:multidrug efflux pump subunit AcrA (membrane-fusion protein)